jgi:hypothetical protein
VKHCAKTLEDASACREVKSASVAFKAKVLKSEHNLTSDLALLALALDLRSGNKVEWVNDMKALIRAVLSSKYGIVLSNETFCPTTTEYLSGDRGTRRRLVCW